MAVGERKGRRWRESGGGRAGARRKIDRLVSGFVVFTTAALGSRGCKAQSFCSFLSSSTQDHVFHFLQQGEAAENTAPASAEKNVASIPARGCMLVSYGFVDTGEPYRRGQKRMPGASHPGLNL